MALVPYNGPYICHLNLRGPLTSHVCRRRLRLTSCAVHAIDPCLVENIDVWLAAPMAVPAAYILHTL